MSTTYYTIHDQMNHRQDQFSLKAQPCHQARHLRLPEVLLRVGFGAEDGVGSARQTDVEIAGTLHQRLDHVPELRNEYWRFCLHLALTIPQTRQLPGHR